MPNKKWFPRSIVIACICLGMLLSNLPWTHAATLTRPKVPKTGVISAGMMQNVYLSPEGNVVFSTSDPNTVEWTGIVAVDAGIHCPIGLKANGTVVSDDETLKVSGWKDIVAVAAGDGFALGLKANGTVVAAGENGKGQCKTSGWKNVSAISAGWEHAVALLADGTVVATGDNSFGQCDVSEWEDIIQVSTCYSYTVGLKSDGTVIVAGSPEIPGMIGPQGTLCWTNIIAVTTSVDTVYGLREDGVVLKYSERFTDDAASAQMQLSWDYPIDIIAFDAGYYHLACMDRSGELYFLGGGQAGETDACRMMGSKGRHYFDKDGNSYSCCICGYEPKFSGSTGKCTHVFSVIDTDDTGTVKEICNLCGKTQSHSKLSSNILADRLVKTEPENGAYENSVEASNICTDYTGVTRYGVNFRSQDTEVVGTFDIDGYDILECTIITGSDFDPIAQVSMVFYADDRPILTLTDIQFETKTKISLPIYDAETLTVICTNTSFISSEVSTPWTHIILDGTLYAS